MTRTTDKVNEIHALARKRARMDLAGLDITRTEYRNRESAITGEILDHILDALRAQVEGSQS